MEQVNKCAFDLRKHTDWRLEWSRVQPAVPTGNSNAHRSVQINTEMTILLSTGSAMSIHCVL